MSLTKAISINYDLIPKSSLDIYINKLITDLRLPLLIECDCKTVRETPNTHFCIQTSKTALSLNATSVAEVEYQQDQPNGAKFKIIQKMLFSIRQVNLFTHLRNFRPASPPCTRLIKRQSYKNKTRKIQKEGGTATCGQPTQSVCSMNLCLPQELLSYLNVLWHELS
jgi:hypothetical protein